MDTGYIRADILMFLQKAMTQRMAAASGRVILGKEAYALVATNAVKKGDVLTVAQLAGIMGAKHTSLLVRLSACGSAHISIAR